MSEDVRKPEDLAKVDYRLPELGWMEETEKRGEEGTLIQKGNFCYATRPASLERLGMPNPKDWRPKDAEAWRPQDKDWMLPEGWEKTIFFQVRAACASSATRAGSLSLTGVVWPGSAIMS